jgi:HTH-type transcriptional regulator, quorum sensing regulator NprR
MKFLNTAEKIKEIRKKLKMNQEDLVDESLTRGFVSMIETGKRGISRDTAEIICAKFRERAEEIGEELNIDCDYLIRDSRAEAEFYCTKHLEGLEKISNIEEIISIAKEYKLDKVLAKAYLQLGDVFFNEKDYLKAHINYLNALDYYKSIDVSYKEPYIYNKLGLCKLNRLEVLEALTYFNLANYHAVLHDNDNIKKTSIYNIALCNKKLDKIDAALEYINIYLSIYDKEKDFTIYIYINVLKAICYEAQNSIDTSILILTDLFREFKDADDPLLGYVYNNLAEFYLKKGDSDKSLDYFDKAQKIRTKRDVNNLSHTLIEKACIYIEKKLYEQAISLVNEGLDLAHTNNDIEYLLKGYLLLADAYLNLKRNKDAENAYEILLGILKKDSKIYKDELIGVYIKMARLYLKQNDYNKLDKTLVILNDISGL